MRKLKDIFFPKIPSRPPTEEELKERRKKNIDRIVLNILMRKK